MLKLRFFEIVAKIPRILLGLFVIFRNFNFNFVGLVIGTKHLDVGVVWGHDNIYFFLLAIAILIADFIVDFNFLIFFLILVAHGHIRPLLIEH